MNNNTEFLRNELMAMRKRRAVIVVERDEAKCHLRTAKAALVAGTSGASPVASASANVDAYNVALGSIEATIAKTSEQLERATARQTGAEALARAREIVAQLDTEHAEGAQIFLEAEESLRQSIGEISHKRNTIERLRREFAELPDFDYRALGAARDVATRPLENPFSLESKEAAYGVACGLLATDNARQNELDRLRYEERNTKRKPELRFTDKGVSTMPPLADDENLDRDLDDLRNLGYQDEREYQQLKELQA